MTAATLGAATVAALLALGPAAGAAPSPVTGATGPAAPVTAPTSGCQVVAAGRAGRAWLPWARLVTPGARLVSADVVAGVARADVEAGTVLLQRTSRRSPGAVGPVAVAVLVAGPEGVSWRECTVDLGHPDVDSTHHVRRLSA